MCRYQRVALAAVTLVFGAMAGASEMAASTNVGWKATGRTAARTLPAGEIVFARTIGSAGRPSLYAMASDGSHLRLLVRNAGNAAVSPDGNEIAFVRVSAIWVMRRNGSGQHQLTWPTIRPAKVAQTDRDRHGRLTAGLSTSRAGRNRHTRARSSRFRPTAAVSTRSREQRRATRAIARTTPRPRSTGGRLLLLSRSTASMAATCSSLASRRQGKPRGCRSGSRVPGSTTTRLGSAAADLRTPSWTLTRTSAPRTGSASPASTSCRRTAPVRGGSRRPMSMRRPGRPTAGGSST